MRFKSGREGCTFGCKEMKNKLVKRALLFCLTALMVLFAAVALADDPIVCEMEVSQAVLTGEGTVRVNINVINVSDDGDAISVTLYDPAKNVCASFGSGGTANLAPGSSASYSGSWTVTQEQLNAGKITYIASYKVTDAGYFTALKQLFNEGDE